MRKAGRAGGRAGSVEDKAKAGRAASPSKKREEKKVATSPSRQIFSDLQ